MMRRVLTIFLSLLGCISLLAQNPNKADELFKQGDWSAACALYKRLHQKEPQNHIYMYRYARCLGELGQAEQAISLFEQVNNIPLRDFFVAREYYKEYRFIDAINALDTYLSSIRPENERYETAVQLKTKAEAGARALVKTEDVQIYAAVVAPLASWRDSLRLSKEAGSISADGSYTNQLGDRRLFADSAGHIFSQTRLMDDWAEPELLPFEGRNPFLAADGVTVYYSAVNANGMGRYDLYMTRLNTATQTYLQPLMLNPPFSSTGDDLFYAVDETSGRGVFVSQMTDSTVVLYRFVANDEKRFMRHVEEAKIRQMARRQLIRPMEEKPAPKVEEEPAEPLQKPVVSLSPLDSLRRAYHYAETDEERAALAPQILKLEAEQAEQRNQ